MEAFQLKADSCALKGNILLELHNLRVLPSALARVSLSQHRGLRSTQKQKSRLRQSQCCFLGKEGESNFGTHNFQPVPVPVPSRALSLRDSHPYPITGHERSSTPRHCKRLSSSRSSRGQKKGGKEKLGGRAERRAMMRSTGRREKRHKAGKEMN